MKLTVIVAIFIILAMFSVTAIINTDLVTKPASSQEVFHTITTPKSEAYSYAASIRECAAPFIKAHTELMLTNRPLSKLELAQIEIMATELCKQNPGLSYDF